MTQRSVQSVTGAAAGQQRSWGGVGEHSAAERLTGPSSPSCTSQPLLPSAIQLSSSLLCPRRSLCLSTSEGKDTQLLSALCPLLFLGLSVRAGEQIETDDTEPRRITHTLRSLRTTSALSPFTSPVSCVTRCHLLCVVRLCQRDNDRGMGCAACAVHSALPLLSASVKLCVSPIRRPLDDHTTTHIPLTQHSADREPAAAQRPSLAGCVCVRSGETPAVCERGGAGCNRKKCRNRALGSCHTHHHTHTRVNSSLSSQLLM